MTVDYKEGRSWIIADPPSLFIKYLALYLELADPSYACQVVPAYTGGQVVGYLRKGQQEQGQENHQQDDTQQFCEPGIHIVVFIFVTPFPLYLFAQIYTVPAD